MTLMTTVADLPTDRPLIHVLEFAGIATDPVIERAAKKVLKEGADFDIREVLA